MTSSGKKLKNPVRVPDNMFDRIQVRSGLSMPNNSQMARVSEQGSSISSEEKRDSVLKANLEQRYRRLKNVRKHLGTVRASLALLSTVDKAARMQLLAAAIKKVTLLAEHPNLPQGASKPIRQAYNELVSIREGVATVAKVDRQNLAVIKLESADAEFEKMLTATKNRIAVVEGADASDVYMDKLLERAKEIIKKSNRESKRLDNIRTKPVVLDRVPIVPITKPAINTAKLDSYGISNDNLGGYALLHNQMVIGINKTALKPMANGKMEKPIDAARRYCKAFEKSVGRKLQIVDNQSVHYGGGVWFWIADERTVNYLIRSANGSLKIMQWGFGFSSSKPDTEEETQ